MKWHKIIKSKVFDERENFLITPIGEDWSDLTFEAYLEELKNEHDLTLKEEEFLYKYFDQIKKEQQENGGE